MILLDTHVLIWLAEGSDRLGREARRAIAERAGAICLSAMTFWEIGMLIDKGRVTLSMPVGNLLDRAVVQRGMTIIPVTAEIALGAHDLPRLHGDPVDRLLIATARDRDCPIVTADRVIADYAAAGHVRMVDARR